MTKIQRQVDEDRHPKTAITVRQAITQWLEVVDLEVTIRERYDYLIRFHILPTLGDMQASKLDAELLERFYARLHRCRELRSGRPPRLWNFQKSAAYAEQQLRAARSYLLIKSPRTGRRLIRSWLRSATGWLGWGGRRSWARCGRRPL